MQINKIEAKKKLKSVTFEVPTELIGEMNTLDQWLDENEYFEGSLEWEEDIEAAITTDIEKRKKETPPPTTAYKIKLPETLANDIKADSRFNWNARVTRIIKSLVTKNRHALAQLSEDASPVSDAPFQDHMP